MTKPRAHAKLKTLPDQLQADLSEFARNHTLVQTVEWLQASGISASKSTVSEFLRWYRERQGFERSQKLLRAEIIDAIAEDRRPNEDALARLGTTVFGVSAIENLDPRAWCSTQQLALRRDELNLKARRSQTMPTDKTGAPKEITRDRQPTSPNTAGI
jgi:hypothetical protein